MFSCFNPIPDDADYLTFAGLQCRGKITKVIDGDTVDLLLEVPNRRLLQRSASGSTWIKVRARLGGIDCYEKKTVQGKQATELMTTWYSEVKNVVWCSVGKPDKYGRTLVTLFPRVGAESFNDRILKAGLAVRYEGGKKML